MRIFVIIVLIITLPALADDTGNENLRQYSKEDLDFMSEELCHASASNSEAFFNVFQDSKWTIEEYRQYLTKAQKQPLTRAAKRQIEYAILGATQISARRAYDAVLRRCLFDNRREKR